VWRSVERLKKEKGGERSLGFDERAGGKNYILNLGV